MKKLFNIILSVAALLLMAQSIFANTKPISFATEATYPPFENVDASGKIQGFDVDVIKALCQHMKAQCTFSNQPFDSLIPSLQLGKFDGVFGAMSITEARKKEVDFTDPYYYAKVSFIAPKSTKLETSKAGLQDKTIGVQAGTTLAQYLQETYGNVVTIKTYGSEEDALLDLVSGRVDAVLGDTPLVQQWLKVKGHEDFQVIGKSVTNVKYFNNGFGIAVKKGNTKLLQDLNKALKTIKADGTVKKLEQKYFGENS